MFDAFTIIAVCYENVCDFYWWQVTGTANTSMIVASVYDIRNA